MAKCKKCNAEFGPDLHYDSKSGEQMFHCPECGAKHIARQLPTPEGAPAEFDTELADK